MIQTHIWNVKARWVEWFASLHVSVNILWADAYVYITWSESHEYWWWAPVSASKKNHACRRSSTIAGSHVACRHRRSLSANSVGVCYSSSVHARRRLPPTTGVRQPSLTSIVRRRRRVLLTTGVRDRWSSSAAGPSRPSSGSAFCRRRCDPPAFSTQSTPISRSGKCCFGKENSRS